VGKVASVTEGILVFPHVPMGGGAGFYNRQLFSWLGERSELHFAGRWGASYSVNVRQRFTILETVTFPNYRGVSHAVSLLYLVRSILNILRRFSCLRPWAKTLPRTIVFTSSLQMLAPVLLKRVRQDICVVLFVQENLRYDSVLFGTLSKYLLRYVDLLVNITSAQHQHALDASLPSILVYNRFGLNRLEQQSDFFRFFHPFYDAVFVGGDRGIKGFSTVVRAYLNVARAARFRLLIVGHMRARSKLLVGWLNRRLASNGSVVHLIGHQPSIYGALLNAKVLLHPMRAPHFARPAIEAGLINRTFIVPAFSEIDDYAIDGFNCLTYDDFHSLVRLLISVADGQVPLQSLADNNHNLALRYHYDEGEKLSFLQRFSQICDTMSD
jgi:hypothetical protein